MALRGAHRGALLLGLAAGALVPLASARADAAVTDPALARLETQLHRAVNSLRTRRGLIPLRRQADLDAVARAHSADMVARRYLAHETPEGVDPVQRLLRAGIAGFSLAGENAGLTSRADANREILNGWIVSPIHRVNLLAPAFNATGIGVVRAGDGTLYYTQVYVTFPSPSAPAPSRTSRSGVQPSQAESP